MAPNRLRAADDSRPESSTSTGRLAGQGGNSTTAKNKRGGAGTAAGAGSNLKDVTSAADAAAPSNPDGTSSGINWSSFPPSTLSAYRHAYRLHTPSSYRSLSSQALLNHPRGLGRHSPSMIGRQRALIASNGGAATGMGVDRRVPKEHLAMAVRKDFNAAAVNEAEVVTNFLYVVKNQDKKFRMRFTPGKK